MLSLRIGYDENAKCVMFSIIIIIIHVKYYITQITETFRIMLQVHALYMYANT